MVRIISKNKLSPKPFLDEVHDMGEFIKKHPEIFGEDARIISQEIAHGPDDRRVDFLVYYPDEDLIGIVELKREAANEKVLLQTLRYADWLKKNPDTLKYAIARSKQGIDPEKLDLKSLKIVIIAPKISTYAVELSQYIQEFEFEFIQLQRFVDNKGEDLAVIEPVEAEVRKYSPSTQRLEYSDEFYAQKGIGKKQLDALNIAKEQLTGICEREGFKLNPKNVKGAIKFQTASGKNVFTIAIRKQKDHYLRIVLGQAYLLKSVDVPAKVKAAIKQSSKNRRVWSVPLTQFPLQRLLPLLRDAYREVAGE
jgi:RecB family endonuclease NucS